MGKQAGISVCTYTRSHFISPFKEPKIHVNVRMVAIVSARVLNCYIVYILRTFDPRYSIIYGCHWMSGNEFCRRKFCVCTSVHVAIIAWISNDEQEKKYPLKMAVNKNILELRK